MCPVQAVLLPCFEYNVQLYSCTAVYLIYMYRPSRARRKCRLWRQDETIFHILFQEMQMDQTRLSTKNATLMLLGVRTLDRCTPMWT